MSKLLSVIIPVGLRYGDIEPLYHEYKSGLEQLGVPYEVIVALDGPHPSVAAGLERLKARGEDLTVLQLSRRFGESAALVAACERASGELILTLPAYPQIQAQDLARLLASMDKTDLAIGYRSPRSGNAFERARRWTFHALLSWVTGLRFTDLGCGARMMRRQVLEEIHPYGAQHRFLAILADRLGFRVQEVPLRQSSRDRYLGRYRLREYAHQVLDIFNVFFLVRFTKRPLRFFGSLGAITFGLGGLVIAILVAQRLFFGVALADRPALLLASLLAVLGMQLFALGLLGELIIFTHAREMKDYRIDQIVQSESAAPPPALDNASADEIKRLPRTEPHMPPADAVLRIPTTTV